MEGLQDTFRNLSQDPNLISTVASISSTFEKAKASFKNLSSDSSPASSVSISTQPPPPLLLTRQPKNVVSLLTCSKLCAVCFVVGVVAGYTLKRRVRRWASRLLKRIKDD